MATQDPWPAVKRQRIADFVTPDGYLRNERNVAGPLRMGTARGAGPSGLVPGGGASDFGLDKVSPRRMDPAGTSSERNPQRRESSTLLSRQVRSRKIDR